MIFRQGATEAQQPVQIVLFFSLQVWLFQHRVSILQFAKLSSQLTHANSLGYNGGILQALAVHYALQGKLNRDEFLEQLIGHMEDVEADDKSVGDARV